MVSSDGEENQAGGSRRAVPTSLRERQRAVAEREAARLARPEARSRRSLGHADRKKSAVNSTPFGFLAKKRDSEEQDQAWCGPFSVARQMIAQREEAKLKRLREQEEDADPAHPLDQAMKEVESENSKRMHPSMQWKGTLSREKLSGFAKRQKRASNMVERIPSLFQLCVDFLVRNFEYVESLGDVDSSIRSSVAKALVDRGRLDNEAFQALAEVGIEALEIVDCSSITHDQLRNSLKTLVPAGLKYLILNQCGRCFTAKTAQVVADSPRNQLRALSIGGAYLLSDEAAENLLESVAKTATSLEFKACPLLGSKFCNALATGFQDNSSLVELTLEDVPFGASHFECLASQPGALKNIQNLSLQRLPELTDERLAKLLAIAGPNLQGLDLTGDYSLTDGTLASIRQYCPSLSSLNLTGLRLLSSEGLEALFMHVEGNEPPMLRHVILQQCDHEAITDEVVTLIVRASTRRQVANDATALLGGLRQLDIQGSTVVTDEGLEQVTAYCSGTLQDLNVSYCTQITSKGLGYLVDRVGPQLKKLQLWGLAQINDEFLDGHRRVNDPTLEIQGAWMKKTGLVT